MKKILVLKCTPRIDGNSDKLADAFITGALSAGNKVETITLRNLQLNGCIACERCWSKGKPCIQTDDMEVIYEAMTKAEVMVWATPIYYFNFPSQLKKVIDRFYSIDPNLHPEKNSIKELVLLLTGADDNRETYSAVQATYHLIHQQMNWSDRGTIIAQGVWEVSDIDDTSFLEQAETMGKHME